MIELLPYAKVSGSYSLSLSPAFISSYRGKTVTSLVNSILLRIINEFALKITLLSIVILAAISVIYSAFWLLSNYFKKNSQLKKTEDLSPCILSKALKPFTDVSSSIAQQSESKRWEVYYQNTVHIKKPRKTLSLAQKYFQLENKTSGRAADLGAGAGRDTLFLLEKG